MKQNGVLTQEVAWARSRRELIQMIGAGLLERNNEIVIATIAGTEDAILTTIDLIPMGTESILDEFRCIMDDFPEEHKKLYPERYENPRSRPTNAQIEAWENEKRLKE